ncbi:Putative FBD-associated F-box protein [Glycine soja]|uniref:Putative FBD-associated F-box protein n=1 Tax=Glycine soja TaxID=3848 RepID=A0A0B2REL7_GLYSO|nr:Putative FBD-associated F-box protein [Glycine soja]
MEEGKETKGKLTTEPMIQRTTEEERDRLSELPDFVLLHIMNFIDTKDALRTCILSKRWKDLWKHLTTLDLSNLATMGSQPPCFVKLESLKVVTYLFRVISDEEVNKAVEYLLQNSPLIRVLLSKKLYHGSLLNYLGPVLAGLANHNRSQIGPSLEWDHNHQHHKGGL